MTKIITLITILLLTGNSLLAQGIKLLDNKSWNEIKALAKKENKMIFLDAYATWCGPCVYMQKEVFTSSEVGSYFNKNFINAKIDMEKGEGPWLAENLGLVGYPTLYFFNPDGELVHKYIGALNTNDFIALAIEAQKPENQFYTLKKRAVNGQLTTDAFHDWIHRAYEYGEKDIDDTITLYLAGKPDMIFDKHLAIIILDHAPSITEEQFKLLNAELDQLELVTNVPKNEILKQLQNKKVK
jgi:thiol-disulfide isomerase/thioredoxin